MSKKVKVKELNITPVSNYIIITSNLIAPKSDLLLVGKPTFSSIQQVVAIGPRVEEVVIGDWIYIDFSRFLKHVKVKSKIRAGIGGEDMIKEEFVPPEFIAPGDPNAYFKITDREIEGVIKDYNILPKEEKETVSVLDYEERQIKLMEEAEEEKKAMKKAEALAKGKRLFKKGKKEVDGPAIIAEGKFRG